MVISVFIGAFLISFLVQFCFIKHSSLRCLFNDCEQTPKPQRFHSEPTPRSGGLGVFAAFAATGLALALARGGEIGSVLPFIVLASIPAFLAGICEDFGMSINPRLRLAMIGGGGGLAMILLQVSLSNFEIFRLPHWIAVPVTVLAIAGVTNAINIIDGFNGLASGVALIALISFASVSVICGDQLVLALSLTLMASLLGFFVWNFPKGRIFLGDGGAYFTGFMLAIISIMLVNRNAPAEFPAYLGAHASNYVSPWFPLVVISYPVFETIFSIYRKKFKRGGSPFEPDRVHFHMLVYKRVTKNNPMTSVYLWGIVIFFNAVAIPAHNLNFALIPTFIIFSATYVYLYRKIVRFRRRGVKEAYAQRS